MERGPAILFAIASLLAGVAGGYALAPKGGDAAPAAPPAKECPKPTDAELEALCGERGKSDKEALVFAQTQVDSLSAELATKEKELADAQAAAEKATDQKAALTEKARKLEGEIGSLKGKLKAATDERDRLVTELKDTIAKLEVQTADAEAARAETRVWQGKTGQEQWKGFIAEAKVRICDRGTAKKHEACHDAVEAALAAQVAGPFFKCVGSGQAVPTLGQLDKNQRPPAHAAVLPEDKSFPDKGWFVQLCDPSLPEARDPGAAPPKEPAAPSKDPAVPTDKPKP